MKFGINIMNIDFLKTPDLWDKWFDEVEHVAESQWLQIQPFLLYEKGHTVEIAAGGGRFTKYLIEISDTVTAVDLNQYAIDRLKKRFKGITIKKNNGKDLKGIKEADFVFSFDSMVHFDHELVFGYIDEVYRVLNKGGRAFLHLSNLTQGNTDITKNPHWRAIGGAELFADYAKRLGFEMVDVIEWDWGVKSLDCILRLQK